ncbi:hypothetical protein LCO01nite_00720 [Lapidilactobacillus concavus]|nr:hypothetical protein LCO01nite_00720 [Lapidilactobacillus concavus]
MKVADPIRSSAINNQDDCPRPIFRLTFLNAFSILRLIYPLTWSREAKKVFRLVDNSANYRNNEG